MLRIVATVHGLELSDNNAGLRQHILRPNRIAPNLLDCRTIVLAEVGDRFVIRREPCGQPHHLNIAASLALQPPARLAGFVHEESDHFAFGVGGACGP